MSATSYRDPSYSGAIADTDALSSGTSRVNRWILWVGIVGGMISVAGDADVPGPCSATAPGRPPF